MKELHIVVRLDDDAVPLFARAVEDLTDMPELGVESWGAHVHDSPSGEIIGWRVVQPTVERDFTEHKDAAWFAARSGGDIYPIFAEEGLSHA